MIFNIFADLVHKLKGFVQKEIPVDQELDLAFLASQINEWKNSPERREQLNGSMYYAGNHDILLKKRTVIGAGGELEEATNLPNRHDIDNQYAIAVDKKSNYFVGKPLTWQTDDERYSAELEQVLDRSFQRRLKNLAKESMNGGLAWLYPYYDEAGNFLLKVLPAYEILPFWEDTEHDKLQFAVRLYTVVQYDRYHKRNWIEKVEVYRIDGVYRFILSGNGLTPDPDLPYQSYITANGQPWNWERIPLIAFKYNAAEIPLIRRVKSLQDALNEMLSMLHNNMLEDNRNTILVIKNYDGENLGEFRRNLSQYGAIKVRTVDGADGGVDTLQVEVNAENYQLIITLIKDALTENARSFNGKLLNSGTPNQMNILSMYQDIDIDTNEFETEYQAAMQELKWFIDADLNMRRRGDYFNTPVEFIFNRDMLMNESEIMNTLMQAGVKISNKTLLSQVPWINDVDQELENLKEEQEESVNLYGDAFNFAKEEEVEADDRELNE